MGTRYDAMCGTQRDYMNKIARIFVVSDGSRSYPDSKKCVIKEETCWVVSFLLLREKCVSHAKMVKK